MKYLIYFNPHVCIYLAKCMTPGIRSFGVGDTACAAVCDLRDRLAENAS